jgi:hypothetical protein
MAVRAIPPGRCESLRLKSQRGGSSRKGGAIFILGDKRKGPGWAATAGSPIRKYSDFRIDAHCCVKRLILNQAFTHYSA